MNLKMLAVIAAGGAIGAASRFVMMSGVGHIWKQAFPLSTLLVNILGSFIIGILAEVMMRYEGFDLMWRSFLIVGVLGGFTTFSSFSLDVSLLLQKSQWLMAGGYIVLSVVVSVFACFGGVALMRVWLS